MTVSSLQHEGCAAVLVTSDTCSRDANKDDSGKYVADQLTQRFSHVDKYIVADDFQSIVERMQAILSNENNHLIITVGGTGLCPRDVTPEATSSLYQKHCTGISTALMMTSLRYSRYAALSRLTAGIYKSCLIVNFPGKLKACQECFACLDCFLDHALEQVDFDETAIRLRHLLDDVDNDDDDDDDDDDENNSPGSRLQSSSNSIMHPPSLIQVQTTSSHSRDQYDIDDDDRQDAESQQELSPVEKTHNIINMDSASYSLTEQESIFERLLQREDKLSAPLIDLGPTLDCDSSRIESLYNLVEFKDALEILGCKSAKLCQEELDMPIDTNDTSHRVLGCTLARDIHSQSLVPPFPVSTMDGYVVNVPEEIRPFAPTIKTVHGRVLDNLAEFERMQADPADQKGFFCYKINTGGRVPEQNFAITPIENTGPMVQSEAGSSVKIYSLELDKYIRPAGSDINVSDFVKAGSRIGPVEVGLIQSMGYKSVKIVKKPVIGLISTGDELVEPHSHDGEDLSKVIDVNTGVLSSLFVGRGYQVECYGIAKDNQRDILLKIQQSLEKCDILVITGGASMGSKDYVKDVIQKIGAEIHFGRVNMKPGKPVAFASLTMDGTEKFIFSLPGNPVSAYITSITLIIPFVEHGIRNHTVADLPLSMRTIGTPISVEIMSLSDTRDMTDSYEFDGRLEFVRAQFIESRQDDGNWTLNKPYPVNVSVKQQSSRLLNLRFCDCLIIVDPSLKGSKFLVGQIYPALKLEQ